MKHVRSNAGRWEGRASVARAASASLESFLSPGAGQDVRIEGEDVIGSSLVVDDHPVQMELFRRNEGWQAPPIPSDSGDPRMGGSCLISSDFSYTGRPLLLPVRVSLLGAVPRCDVAFPAHSANGAEVDILMEVGLHPAPARLDCGRFACS